MSKIAITMTTVREIDESEYPAWRQSLLIAGYPLEVLKELDEHQTAIWSQPELGVETQITVAK